MEGAKTPEEINRVINHLIEWLKSPEQGSIRRSFAVWIKRVLLSEEEIDKPSLHSINDLMEIRIMLAERVTQWNKEWLQQGLEQGLEQGRNEY